MSAGVRWQVAGSSWTTTRPGQRGDVYRDSYGWCWEVRVWAHRHWWNTSGRTTSPTRAKRLAGAAIRALLAPEAP